MAVALRKSGIGFLGDIPWGTHFCHFFETKDDLLETLLPYFKAGLEGASSASGSLPSPLRRPRHVTRSDELCRIWNDTKRKGA
jgi:hypothetical protein